MTSACGVATSPKPEIGAVVQKVHLCLSPEHCMATLGTLCKHGGVIHGAAPVMAIKYTCNP